MADLRTADLQDAPDPRREIRLQLTDCVVSIWLPADVRAMGKAIEALHNAGFEITESESGARTATLRPEP